MTTDPLELAPSARLRVLVIGSASAANSVRAVAAVRARFPHARITLAVAGEPLPPLRAAGAVDLVVGATLASLRRLPRYDVKVALFTGEGYAALKLAAFLAPAPRLLVFSEGGGMFWWSFDDRLAVWNHLRWRLSGGGPLPARLARLARAITNPIIAFVAFLCLLGWHARSAVTRWRGRG